MKNWMKIALTAASLAGAAGSVAAETLPAETLHAGYRETGAAQDWVGVFRPEGPSAAPEVCAIYSRPKASQVFKGGEVVDQIRGELAAYINWNGETPTIRSGEVSFMMGTPVSEGVSTHHKLGVDGKVSFDLFGYGDRLYTQQKDDAKVIEAIRAGTTMQVTALLEDGTIARDDYSLMGVVATTALSVDGCR